MTRPSLKVSLIIFALALFFRLWQLGQTSIHMDEVTWMVHSKELVYAIAKHDLSFFKDKAWWNLTTENYAIGLPGSFLSGVSYSLLAGVSRYSLRVLPDIVAARLPTVLIGSLFPVLLYQFLALVEQSQVGVLASIGLILSPLMLASDRWILHDSYLALFSFLGVTGFYLAGKRKRLSLWPGFWLALAFLTKPHGVLIVIAWLGCLFDRPNFKSYLRLFLLNFLSFYLFTLLLWPTAWANPIWAIPEYLWRQLHLAQVPIISLFQGRVMADPGPLFYPFHLLLRNPEIVVLGFFCALILFWFLPQKKQKLLVGAPFILYSLAFYLLIHFSGTKAGPRYLLPIIPWFYILSAFGLVWLFRRLNPYLRFGILTLGAASLLSVLVYFPDPQIYFNQFVEGPKGVAGYSRLGVCLGGKQALDLLDKRGVTGSYYLYGCADMAPYYTGRPQTKDLKEAQYVIVETWLSELHPDDEYLTYVKFHFKLLTFIDQHGAITARIYQRL